MRILHVLNHTDRLNGNVHAAIDLACAQAGLGLDVAVCSRGGSFDALLTRKGVESITIDQTRSLPVIAGALVKLTRLVKAWRPDVVHAHMMTSAVLAWPACRLFGIPLVTTVHNEFERSAVLMGLGDRVIAVSDAVGEAMRRRGISASRLRIVLNGTIGSARHAAPPPAPAPLEHPAVVFLGGLHPRKGVQDLLQAFDLVCRTQRDATLYLVGEGPSSADYKACVAAMDCADRVVFCGSTDDPRPFLRAADIFVLPSHADPAPLVLSEAREAGCAIVGTMVGGIPELLEHGSAGILVPPREPRLLAEALMGLLRDPASLAAWKRNSQVNIGHLSIGRVAGDTLDIYRECQHAAPSPVARTSFR